MSASCSMAPTHAGRRAWGACRKQLSGPRESWERQTTGTLSSLAMIFRAREMSETICWRLSPERVEPPAEVISWR